MHSDLARIAGEVEAEWPTGLDLRRMAYAIADKAGVPVDQVMFGVGKGVILTGRYAIKTGGPWQIADSLKCAAILGDRYATIYASGRCWMIQERVKPMPEAWAFSREAGKLGVADTRRNCGQRDSGEVVAFDGFPTAKN